MTRRDLIWNKSQGQCWYCGCDLPVKGWHIDHMEPIVRYKHKGTTTLGKPQNENIDNMVPACAPCNIFKSVFSIEEFRRELTQQVIRARKTSVNFRTAERFGMLEANCKPIVFWFESQHTGNTGNE